MIKDCNYIWRTKINSIHLHNRKTLLSLCKQFLWEEHALFCQEMFIVSCFHAKKTGESYQISNVANSRKTDNRSNSCPQECFNELFEYPQKRLFWQSEVNVPQIQRLKHLLALWTVLFLTDYRDSPKFPNPQF